MDLSLPVLIELARFTVQRPREGARMVMRADLPMNARWVGLAITAIVSAVLAHLSISLLPPAEQAQMAEMVLSPIGSAVLQASLMVVSVFLVHGLGRFLGGQGNFADALILMVWLQFILLLLQVAQIVIQVVVPPLSDFVGVASVFLFLWLLSNFVAELHGFRSVLKVFFGIVAVLVAMAFVLAFLMLPIIAAGV